MLLRITAVLLPAPSYYRSGYCFASTCVSLPVPQAPWHFVLERTKIKVKDSKIVKIPKSFFGDNSAANVPIYLKQRPHCFNSGAGMFAVPCTAEFLIDFTLDNPIETGGMRCVELYILIRCQSAIHINRSVLQDGQINIRDGCTRW